MSCRRTGFSNQKWAGRFVVLDIEDYERDYAEKKLLMKLQEAEAAMKAGQKWLILDELKQLMEK